MLTAEKIFKGTVERNARIIGKFFVDRGETITLKTVSERICLCFGPLRYTPIAHALIISLRNTPGTITKSVAGTKITF